MLGNTITTFEIGHLLYDTRVAACASPGMTGHHVLLAAALSWLQAHVARGREYGTWAVTVLLLMEPPVVALQC